MKLLIEDIDFNSIQIIKEEKENKEKKFRIKAPFLVSEEKNKNKRIYSKPTVIRETANFVNTKIKRKNAYGELDHPLTPTVSAKNASIHIDDLVMDGNISIGTASVLDYLPNGRIVYGILDHGLCLGVSSRGVGTVNGEHVNDSYKFITEDVVVDPSQSGAYIESILENKEYIIGVDGEIIEKAFDNLQESVDKKWESKMLLGYMLNFINDIKNKLSK